LAGRIDEARQAWERAIGLTDDPALRHYLSERIAASA
jgi:predicted RNA polymerase sigma factor